MTFLETFEFPNYKKQKKSDTPNILPKTTYRTSKSRKQNRLSFSEFVEDTNIDKARFERIVEKCKVDFSKVDSFFWVMFKMSDSRWLEYKLRRLQKTPNDGEGQDGEIQEGP